MRYLAFSRPPALLAPAVAQAQTEDLLGKYASAKIYCIDDEKLVFEIARGVINGPNFHCIFGNPRPAGTGIEDYDSKCTHRGRGAGRRSSPSTLPTRPTMSG